MTKRMKSKALTYFISLKTFFNSQQNSNPAENETVVKKTTLSEFFTEFAEHTTAHGFSHLVIAKSRIHKLVCLILMCFTYVIMGVTIQPMIGKYRSHPTTTTESVTQENHPVYPMIVICNQNMLRKSKYGQLLLELNKTQSLFHPWRVLPQTKNPYEYSHQIYDVITQCDMYGVSNMCTPTTNATKNDEIGWYTSWYWKYGACWTFNSGISNTSKATLKKSYMTGPHAGITMRFHIQQDEYTNETTAAGIRVYVGEQGKYPSVADDGQSFGPGRAYDTVIKKTFHERIDRFSNGSCSMHKNISLTEFITKQEFIVEKSTTNFCNNVCISKFMAIQCGCIHYQLPIPFEYRNVDICKVDDSECTKKLRKGMEDGKLACKCTPPCNEVTYSLSSTSLNYPTKVYRDFEISRGREDPAVNELLINFYFKDSHFTKVTEDDSYDGYDLISDLGGQLGLFCGFSVITAFEFLVFFILLPKYIRRMRKRKTRINRISR